MPPYAKTNWQNEIPAETPVKYKITEVTDGDITPGATIEPVTGITPGTPLNSTNLQNIEDGIEALNGHDHTAEPGAKIPTAGLANNFLYRRQGGDPSVWKDAGVNTYTPSTVRMQAGSLEWTGSATSGSLTITFPIAFASDPLCWVSVRTASGWPALFGILAQPSGTQITVLWKSDVTQTSIIFHWLAIGPGG